MTNSKFKNDQSQKKKMKKIDLKNEFFWKMNLYVISDASIIFLEINPESRHRMLPNLSEKDPLGF